MARTNATDVQALLGDAYSASYPVTSFIDTANVMVTKHCVDDAFTVTELELIERYLAAFLYCVSHPRDTSETADGIGSSKQHREDLGLDANEFGQMVKRLDWSGALSSLDNAAKKGLRRSVTVSWAGKPNPDAAETNIL